LIPAALFVVIFFAFLFWGSSNAPDDEARPETAEELVLSLTSSNFHSAIAQGLWMVEFYNPLCSNCIEFAPIWSKTASDFKDSIKAAKVDITKELDLKTLYDIKRYPTVIVFFNGKEIVQYSGERKLEPLQTFVKGVINDADQLAARLDDLDKKRVEEEVFKDLVAELKSPPPLPPITQRPRKDQQLDMDDEQQNLDYEYPMPDDDEEEEDEAEVKRKRRLKKLMKVQDDFPLPN